jgi:hypothetical protein
MSRLPRHTNTANRQMRAVRTPTPSGTLKRATRCPSSPPSSPKSLCSLASPLHKSSREIWRGSTSTTTIVKTSDARRPKQTSKSGNYGRRENEQKKSANTQKHVSASSGRRLRQRAHAATRRAKLQGAKARQEAVAKVSPDRATSSHRRE